MCTVIPASVHLAPCSIPLPGGSVSASITHDCTHVCVFSSMHTSSIYYVPSTVLTKMLDRVSGKKLEIAIEYVGVVPHQG